MEVRIGRQPIQVRIGGDTLFALTAAERAEAAADAAEATAAGLTVTTATSGSLVASRTALANIAGPVVNQAATLIEAGREGTFVFSTANLAAQVTADPDQGIYVPPSSDTTGASGAWVRGDKVLRPEMFGASGTGDQLAILRRAGYWACQLGRPLEAGPNRYILSGNWRVGSATASAPSDGAINNLRMPGRWRFTNPAGGEPYLSFEKGSGVRVGDVDFDITSAATNGHGQVRLTDVDHFAGGNFTKIGTAGSVVALGAVGGSVFSVNGDCDDVSCESAIVEYAGTSASAVFASFGTNGNPTNVRCGYARCRGGQDSADISGVDGFEFGTIEGYDLGDTNEGSLLDCGNSSNGWVGYIKGARVAMAAEFKTEDSGGTHGGSNNVHVEAIDVDDWRNAAFRMAAGATTGTTEQTLHNITIGRLNGTTTLATGATRGIVTAAGDDVADPTRGLRILGGKLVMNDGIGIEHQNGLTEFTFSNLEIDAPTGVSDLTPGAFTTPNKGLYENCYFTGPCTFGHDYTTWRNFKCGGLVTVNEAYHCRMRFIEAPRLDIAFNPSVAAEKDFELDGFRSINANGRALHLRHIGSTDAMTGVTIRNVLMTDDQGSPTSTGFALDNATTDWCIFENVAARGIASTQNRAIPGLNTRHTNVRFRDPIESSFGGGTATIAYLDLIIKENTASSNWALPSDATSAIPIGQKITLWANAASIAFTAGAGATMNGTGTVASGTAKTATKIAANEWLVA